MSEETITVTMTKEHALAVIHGLEMYQRVSMGAWTYVADYAGAEHGICWGPGNPECAALAERLRGLLTPTMQTNQHKGIGNASERAKLTYEVQAQMQQAIAKHEARYGVWNNGALKLTGKPLPTVEIANP